MSISRSTTEMPAQKRGYRYPLFACIYSFAASFCFFSGRRSFWQYWVQSLSVQAAHCSAALLLYQKRSGWMSTQNSHTIHTATASKSSELVKKLPTKSMGVNIIR